MTWYKTVTIECDECGSNEFELEKNSASVAEQEAQENGWEKNGEEHRCPECSEEEEEEETESDGNEAE